MKILMKIALLLAVSFASLNVMAGKYPNPPFMATLEYEVIEVLKKHGMQAAHDRELPWLYIDGAPDSYVLKFHQADEIPQQAVLDIVKLCMNFYEQHGRKEKFRIVMYRQSHDEWRHSLLLGIGVLAGIKPYFELTIEENK